MNASITVYGLDRRIVDVVEDGCFPAEEHSVSWIPSSELASGCYLIRLQTDGGTDVRDCVLLGNLAAFAGILKHLDSIMKF